MLAVALIVLSFFIYREYHSGELIVGIIVLAFIVAFIGLLGFVGALKRSKCGKSHRSLDRAHLTTFSFFSLTHLRHSGRSDHLSARHSPSGRGSANGVVR